MSEREARIARNEAVSREINEGIEDARPTDPGDYLRMVCECGRPDCSSLIAISLREYESVRADPRTFAVDHAHIRPEVEEPRSEEHTSELQSPVHLVCRLLL